MNGLRVWSLVLVGVEACGYPQPDRNMVIGIGGDDDFGSGSDIDIDAPPPDADIDAPPVDAMPDAPPGYFGTAPSSTGASVAISGKTDVGQKLTAIPSGFNLGSPTAGYHYQWQRYSSTAFTTPVNVGSDANTYTLTTADAPSTMYIRVVVTATNACASGCGSSTPVNSSAHGPIRRVVLTKGASCYVEGGCTSSYCKYMHTAIIGFATGSHTLTCNSSNYSPNPWATITTSTWPSDRCCYGFANKTVWTTVDGLKSNSQVW